MALGIMGAEGQQARAQDLWDFIHSVVRIFCTFPREYGMGGPIRSVGWLADVIGWQEFLTDRSVSHFDAVWKARPLVGYVPFDPMERQLLLAETIQMSEGFGGKASNAKTYDQLQISSRPASMCCNAQLT